MKESRQRIVRLRIPESTSAVDRPRERKPDGDGGTRGPHAKRIWPLAGVPWPEIAHVSPMKQRKTIRLTLDVSEEFYARLESLTERVEAESKSSVIRDALRLYEYLVGQLEAGASLRLALPDSTESTVVLFGTGIPARSNLVQPKDPPAARAQRPRRGTAKLKANQRQSE